MNNWSEYAGNERMSKHNFACFDCRSTARREVPDAYNLGDIDRFPRCPHCGQKMDYAGHRGRLPPKTDVKGWTTFKSVLDNRKLEESQNWLSSRLSYVNSLEQTISKLEGLPESPGRNSGIREAKKQLHSLKLQIAEFVQSENTRHIGLI